MDHGSKNQIIAVMDGSVRERDMYLFRGVCCACIGEVLFVSHKG